MAPNHRPVVNLVSRAHRVRSRATCNISVTWSVGPAYDTSLFSDQWLVGERWGGVVRWSNPCALSGFSPRLPRLGWVRSWNVCTIRVSGSDGLGHCFNGLDLITGFCVEICQWCLPTNFLARPPQSVKWAFCVFSYSSRSSIQWLQVDQ